MRMRLPPWILLMLTAFAVSLAAGCAKDDQPRREPARASPAPSATPPRPARPSATPPRPARRPSATPPRPARRPSTTPPRPARRPGEEPSARGRRPPGVAERGLVARGRPIFIRIFKQSRELELWVQRGWRFHLWKTYPICGMSGELGPKLREGDLQAPEGFYFVGPRSLNPNSRFHLSFNVGYPNAYDRAHRRTGSYIMVHGDCVSAGCFAMTDSAIEEIYRIVEAAFASGQPFFRVHIFPFRMTAESMRRQRGSQWAEFWRSLKPGYDHFERTRTPPNVEVQSGRYVFEPTEVTAF